MRTAHFPGDGKPVKSLSSLKNWCLVFFASRALAAPLHGAEIMGEVRDIAGETASVLVEGEVLPAVGDSGEIFFKVVDDAEVSVGSGRILKVENDSIELKIESATGDVTKGQLVRFTSENPQPRAPLTAPSPSLSSPPEQDGIDAATNSPSPPVAGAPSEAARYAAEGLAKMDAGDYKGAIAVYNKWIELNPTNPKPYANRGSSYNVLKQPKRGLTDLNEAIRLDPTISMAYLIRGNIYADLHQLKRAVADYDEALRLDLKNTSAYYSRGTVHAELRQLKRAIDDFSQAIVLNPTYKEAYWNRSQCYKAAGKAQLAKRDFDKVQELKVEGSSNSPTKSAPVPPDP